MQIDYSEVLSDRVKMAIFESIFSVILKNVKRIESSGDYGNSSCVTDL